MARVPDETYRVPSDLAASKFPMRRLMVLGQCLMAGWPEVVRAIHPAVECDFYLINNAQPLPESPPHPSADYDFQVLQLPLRSVLPDAAFFRLSYDDPEAYESTFQVCRERLIHFLHAAMRWNREQGILTFVVNFLTPPQNPMGRLLPRYDLRNLVYFIEKLNEALAGELAAYPNAYLFDFDALAATYGKKYFNDDVVVHTNHGSALADFGDEAKFERLESVPPVQGIYESKVFEYLQYAWREIFAMHKSVAKVDTVKLVAIDLDDTLWRGVAAERGGAHGDMVEGWPLGLAEALGHLKRRGVLLALLSKNEPSLIEPIFNEVFAGRLSLEDFAVRKVNWRPKAENLQETLAEMNLLPRSVVFIDDNPAERAAIQGAFPEVRALPSNPLLWRRILLWSPETQVATITTESSARTVMMQAQISREQDRKRMTRPEFLASLHVRVSLRRLGGESDAGFARAVELVNKSNQFNTTGRRWSARDLHDAAQSPGVIFVFEVADRYTNYGLVGVVALLGARIEQFVMSCRVLGLDVELAVVAYLAGRVASVVGEEWMFAALKETELNLAVRDLWARCGFERAQEDWRLALSPLPQAPAHIAVRIAGGASDASAPIK